MKAKVVGGGEQFAIVCLLVVIQAVVSLQQV